MNIYLVTEDSESFCVRANTMAEALNFCFQEYLEEARIVAPGYTESEEGKYYHAQILQSCALIGELKN